MIFPADSPRETFMRKALILAKEASQRGEVPVGCVITDAEDRIIAEGKNCSREMRDATAHAEMEAIREACRVTGDWRLEGCTLFVTLEPCPMCAGAIMNSRIRKLVFGAKDPVKGACGSVIDLFSEHFPDKAIVDGNVMGEECGTLLSSFFGSVRKGENN